MALNKSQLKSNIKAALEDMLTKEVNSIDAFATVLADVIDAYIKTAKVDVTVVTTGSATNHTGTGTGTLS